MWNHEFWITVNNSTCGVRTADLCYHICSISYGATKIFVILEIEDKKMSTFLSKNSDGVMILYPGSYHHSIWVYFLEKVLILLCFNDRNKKILDLSFYRILKSTQVRPKFTAWISRPPCFSGLILRIEDFFSWQPSFTVISPSFFIKPRQANTSHLSPTFWFHFLSWT